MADAQTYTFRGTLHLIIPGTTYLCADMIYIALFLFFKSPSISFAGNVVTYTFHDTAVEWEDASERCTEEGGLLLTVKSSQVLNRLLQDEQFSYRIRYQEVWMGLKTEKMDCTSYTWVSGEPLTWTRWDFAEPNFCYEEKCIRLRATLWRTSSCYNKHNFICERTIAPLETQINNENDPSTDVNDVSAEQKTSVMTLATTSPVTSATIFAMTPETTSPMTSVTTFAMTPETTSPMIFVTTSAMSPETNSLMTSVTTFAMTPETTPMTSVTTPAMTPETTTATTSETTSRMTSETSSPIIPVMTYTTTSATTSSTNSVMTNTTYITTSLMTPEMTYTKTSVMTTVTTSGTNFVTTSATTPEGISVKTPMTSEIISRTISATTMTTSVTTINLLNSPNYCCDAKAKAVACSSIVWGFNNGSINQELKDQIKKLQAKLKVDRNSTKMYIRSKISVYDSRRSSVTMGILGILVLIMVCSCFVFADLPRLVALTKNKMKPRHLNNRVGTI